MGLLDLEGMDPTLGRSLRLLLEVREGSQCGGRGGQGGKVWARGAGVKDAVGVAGSVDVIDVGDASDHQAIKPSNVLNLLPEMARVRTALFARRVFVFGHSVRAMMCGSGPHSAPTPASSLRLTSNHPLTV